MAKEAEKEGAVGRGVGFWNQEKRVDQEEGPAAVSDAAGVTDGSTGTF